MALELDESLLVVDVGQTQKQLVTGLWLAVDIVEVAVTSDAACEVHVLLHDRLTFCVDCTQVSVLEKTNDVGFSRLLKSKNSL